jgi:glutathione S-transferase
VPYFSENVVKPLFQGKPGDALALGRAESGRDECFDYLEKELGETQFAVANRLSVADIALGAQLITYRQGSGEIAVQRWPKLGAYAASLTARPAWARILAEETSALEAARSRAR